MLIHSSGASAAGDNLVDHGETGIAKENGGLRRLGEVNLYFTRRSGKEREKTTAAVQAIDWLATSYHFFTSFHIPRLSHGIG
jgi:hypothetical protein